MDSSFEGPISAAEETTGREAATPYEPFLQDWYPGPGESPAKGNLVVNNRQLAIVGFIVVLAMALVAGLAYLVGRIASSEPGRVVMVDSAQSLPPVPASQKPPPIPRPVPAEVAAVKAASPVPQSHIPAGDVRGLAFWQVGALDKGMASVSEKYLQESELPVRLEAIPGSNQMRVLVGPAAGTELEALKKKLDGLGFQPFLKQY